MKKEIKNFNAVFENDPQYYDQLRSGYLSKKREKFISKYINHDKIIRIAEIGCGTGGLIWELSNRFSNKSFTGIDALVQYTKFSEKKYKKNNLNFLTENIEEDIPKNNYDLIYSIDVLHHLKNIKLGYKNIINSLKADGLWIIMEPNSANLYIRYSQWIKNDEKNFDKKFLEKNVHAQKNKIIKKLYYLLLPAAIKKPSLILQKMESMLEKHKYLGTSVIYIIQK